MDINVRVAIMPQLRDLKTFMTFTSLSLLNIDKDS